MLIKKWMKKREEEKACDGDRKIERKSGGRKRAIQYNLNILLTNKDTSHFVVICFR